MRLEERRRSGAEAGTREGAFLWRSGVTIRDRDSSEYALIIVVIAIAVIVAMVFLRDQLQNLFSNVGNNLT